LWERKRMYTIRPLGTTAMGYRPRQLDICMGTLYLMVLKLRSRAYIPFFVTERKRSEAALIPCRL